MRTTDLPERAAPLVSVIIPTFERPESLQRAVQSVLTQTVTDLEVIVVNDGGGPLESHVAALSADPRVTYVRTGRNGRVAAAHNAGLRLA
jgi:glycosyltransferase involved in cell wall biosynthesis